jgi:mono/diheme cytochrome c family protein
MYRIGTLVLAVLVVALIAAHGVSAQTPAPAATGDATRGKAAFMAYGCWECHGTQGQGNYGAGARLAPNPRPLAAVMAYVRRPGGQMPSYSAAILPDKDLINIYAYLASIPAGKTPGQLPQLSGTTTKPK